MNEHSERARYVTEQVSLWVQNDGNVFEKAQGFAGDLDDLEAFRTLLLAILRTARKGSAAWQVTQELAPNDYARINWRDVAIQLHD